MDAPEEQRTEDDLRLNLITLAGQVYELIGSVKQTIEGVVPISFPQVVVIGDEGSGKSSLLERIANLELFPKRTEKATLKTRLPIQLEMQYMARDEFDTFCAENDLATSENDDDPVVSRLRYIDKDGGENLETPYKVGSIGVPMADFLDNKMNELIKFKKKGVVAGIVSDVFIIEIKSPYVPNLTLVDLPGIFAARIPGEPSTIGEETENLVKEYLDKPDTLFLVVCRANTRLRSSRAIKALQDKGKEGQALGVLTFCDLAERSGYADTWFELKERVRGTAEDSIPLPHGYVGVVNPDARKERVVPLSESAADERKWFEARTPELLAERSVTINAVIEKVTKLMLSYVRDTWSRSTKTAIRKELTAIDDKLAKLGEPVDRSNRERFLAQVADRVVAQFRMVCENVHFDISLLADPPASGPFTYKVAKSRQEFLGAWCSEVERALNTKRQLRNVKFLHSLESDSELPLNISRFDRIYKSRGKRNSVLGSYLARECPSDLSIELWREDVKTLEVMFRSRQLSGLQMRTSMIQLAKQVFFEGLILDVETKVTRERLLTHFRTIDSARLLRESDVVRSKREELLATKASLTQVLEQIDQLCSMAE